MLWMRLQQLPRREARTRPPRRARAPPPPLPPLAVLRCVTLLIDLLGPAVGRHAPQLLVLLAVGARPPSPTDARLQALAGWRALVAALARHAPPALAAAAAQIAVALLDPAAESGPIAAAAADALAELVLRGGLDAGVLAALPPLPAGVATLVPVRAALAAARGDDSPAARARALLAPLASPSPSVRATAAGELRSLLASARPWLGGVLAAAAARRAVAVGEGDAGVVPPDSPAVAGGGDAGLLGDMVGGLLACCAPGVDTAPSTAAALAAAECLGIIGAVDPALLQLGAPGGSGGGGSGATVTHATSSALARSDRADLPVRLLSSHLLRLLRVADSMQTLDAATYATQEVLRAYSGGGGETASNALLDALPPSDRVVAAPFLHSHYALVAAAPPAPGCVFDTLPPGAPAWRWLALWLRQLVATHAGGPWKPLYDACVPVFRRDVGACRFLLPHAVADALAHGGVAARGDVAAELGAVLAGGRASREGALCVQYAFEVIDTLAAWAAPAVGAGSRAGGATAPSARSPPAPPDAGGVDPAALAALLHELPPDALADAAAAAGAHARAARYAETAARSRHGGGLNPAAARSPVYEDATVTALQAVHRPLGEPDSLAGLARLRPGGAAAADDLLAAEASGAWGDALALYELELGAARSALESSAPGPSSAGGAPRRPSQRGGGGGGRSSSAGGGTQLSPGTDDPASALDAARRGALRALIGGGRLEAALAGVDGWARATPPGATRRRLAAVGVAAAWRLGRWDVLEEHLASVADDGSRGPRDDAPASTPHRRPPPPTAAALAALTDDERWEARIGGALAALHARDAPAFAAALATARADAVPALRAAALESYDRAAPVCVRLHALQEAADAGAMLLGGGALAPAGPLERARRLRWDARLAAVQPSLAAQEPILAVRRSLASLAGADGDVGDAWLALARLARARGHLDAAAAAALEAAARGAPGAGLERARLLWARDRPAAALALVRQAVATAEHRRAGAGGSAPAPADRLGEAEATLQLAEWAAAAGAGAGRDVARLYDAASSLAPRGSRVGAEAHFSYGAYLDALAADARARQAAAAAAAAGGAGTAPTAAGRGGHRGDRLGGRARIALGEEAPYSEIVPLVLRQYSAALGGGGGAVSARAAQALPRLLTVFFEFGSACAAAPGARAAARERQARADVLAAMADLSKSLPPSAWLPALPQLTSRLCHPHADTRGAARALVTRVTAAHPHQSLWALAPVSRSAHPARAEAAAAVLSSARRAADGAGGGRAARDLHASFAALTAQLERLAHHPVDSRARALSVKSDFAALARLLPCGVVVPVAAALASAPAVDGDATTLVSVAGIDDTVTVLSSLQRPKRVTLIGSDGRRYGFLAKPRDDLRKDARMMEVAGVANALFDAAPPRPRARVDPAPVCGPTTHRRLRPDRVGAAHQCAARVLPGSVRGAGRV